MKVAALLSWFDEDPELLYRSISTWAALCDRVIALDGAYAALPGAAPRSSPEQKAAIIDACGDNDMVPYVQTPRDVWRGNQVAKRTALFRLAQALCARGDWWLIIDADEELRLDCVASSWQREIVKDQLEHTDLDAARVTVMADVPLKQPRLVRAQKLTVGPVHFQWVTADNRFLWGRPTVDPVEPWLDTEVVIEHKREARPLERRERQRAYYKSKPEACY